MLCPMNGVETLYVAFNLYSPFKNWGYRQSFSTGD